MKSIQLFQLTSLPHTMLALCVSAFTTLAATASTPAPTCAGSLDPYFQSGTGVSRFDWSASLETVGAMIVGSNQQVIVGGLFNHAQCRQRTGLARFQADGYIDDSFAPVLSPAPSRIEPVVAALVMQPDGRLLIGGKFSAANGHPCPGLARLNYDGSTDPSFAPTQALVAVQALVLQPDHKVLVAGATTMNDYGIPETPALMRLLPNGLPDPSFSFTNAYQDLVRNLLLLPDGKILVNGTLRLNPDGTQDSTFTSVELDGYMVCASLLQPDGKVLLALSDPAGIYPTTGGALVRLLPEGGYDPAFTTQTFYRDSSAEGITANLFALALQADGRMYVGGGFGAIGNDTITLVARLWPNGELDRSFQPSFTYSPGADLPEFVTQLALEADGKLLVGGYFGGINGFSRQNLARLHTADAGCAGLVSMAELNFYVAENGPSANLTLHRSGNTNSSATIAYWTFDWGQFADTTPGNAIAGTDYLPVSGLVTFAPGQTEAQIQIPILDDALIEFGYIGYEEFFGVTLAMAPNSPNAAVSLAQSNLTYVYIVDDDLAPPYGTFDFTNRTFRVAEESPGFITLDVFRSGPNSTLESVEYTTLDGTAKAGLHYLAQSGRLEFAPGDAGHHSITISIFDDNLANADREFRVLLRNPTAGTSLGTNSNARVTILNNDRGVYLSVADPTNNESSASVYGFWVTLTRCGSPDTPWQFQLCASNVTAVAGVDFSLTNSLISFLAGETQKSVRVYGLANPAPGPDKTFDLYLLPASPDALVGEPSSVRCTIQDINRPARILSPPRFNPATGRTEFAVDVSPAFNFYVLGSDDLVHWDLVHGYDWQYGRTTGTIQDRDAPFHRQRFYKISTFPH